MRNIITKLEKVKEVVFLLAIFFLPVYQTINHWFFAGFILVSFCLFFLDKKSFGDLKTVWLLIFGIASFLLLKFFGIFNAIDYDYGIKEATRALPFLLYPLCIISFKNQIVNYNKFEKKVFYALVFGCVLTAIICWTNIIISLKPNDIAADTFFGWKKSGSYLTRILGLHPPYLGLLFVASIVFLLKEVFFNIKITTQNKYINSVISIFLLIFLFNITARNSLFFIMVLSFVFLIYLKKWKLLLVPIISILIATIIIINHPSQYYRIKLYRMLNISEVKYKDKRFIRLEGSWKIFKTSPIVGVGGGNDQILRNQYYELINDKIALKKELNSHNQLFEYLVSIGLIGGLTFLGVNMFFMRLFIRKKQYFYAILLCNILIATITESILERVLGIQYYAILIAMAILALNTYKESTENYLDKI